MSNRTKQEVTSARIRLDATLQHLVDKKEDSQLSSEGEGSNALPEPSIRTSISPKKSISRPNRKRKRRDDSGDTDNADEQQVIMKLFDRSVDMAQFPEETPLYPVCRAWIQNRPQDKSIGTLAPRPPSPDIPREEESEVFPNVYVMPLPIKSEDGCPYNLRIPEPVPQPDEHLDIHADPKSAPAPEHLLLNHMARWKEIRNSWREASEVNDKQYAGSLHLLKDMYDKNAIDG